MRRIVLFAATLIAMLALPAAASAVVVPINDPIYEFTKTGPGVASDWFGALVVSRGQPYVCGAMSSSSHGRDAWVARLSDGPSGWAARYDGSAHSTDVGEAMVACPAGGVYVACSSNNGAGDSDIVVVRYSAAGKRLWAQRWGGSPARNDFAGRIALDGAGNVYVAGRSMPGTALVKYRPDGSRAWARVYRPGTLSAWVADMRVNSDGSVYLAGGRGPFLGATDAMLLKYSAGGLRRWARIWNQTPGDSDRLTAVCRGPKGGVYAVGVTGDGIVDADAVFYRYSASGTRLRFARFGTLDGRDQGFSDCAVDSRGRIATCGYWGQAFNGSQFWVALLTTGGAVSWQIMDGTPFADSARMLVIDSKDRVTVAGTYAAGGGTRDALVVDAFTAAGVPRWFSSSESPSGNVSPLGIARRGSSNVWVCGEKALPAADWAGLVLGWDLGTP